MATVNTVSHARKLSTSDLWSSTHLALCSGQWTSARAQLEALSQRHDVRDMLMSARTYSAPEHMVGLLQVRIDAVNRVAAR